MSYFVYYLICFHKILSMILAFITSTLNFARTDIYRCKVALVAWGFLEIVIVIIGILYLKALNNFDPYRYFFVERS